MAKLTLTDLSNLASETSAVAAINANNAAIEAALENTLSRDGTSPNTMSAVIDMNSNRITNLGAPTNAADAVRKQDLDDVAETISGLDSIDADAIAADAASAAASAADAAASAVEAAGYVGSVASAPTWTTARSITIGGDVEGTSPAWDGSADLTGFTLDLADGAIEGKLGYTPADVAGDTFTGEVRLNYTISGTGNSDGAGFRGIPVGTHDADYTIVGNDNGRMLRHTSASAHAWTLVKSATLALPVGYTVALRNIGTGDVTITRDSGVSLRIVGVSTSQDVVLSQWGFAVATLEATDTWMISGTGIA